MSDAPAYRDRLPAPDAGAAPVLATFAADPGRYWRDIVTWAAILGVLVTVVLAALGMTDVIWAGIVGTFGAMAVRAVWFRPEAMAIRWVLTPDALLGPGGEVIPLGSITRLRSLMGDVQVVTSDGRKRLIRHLADPAAAIARIGAAR